MKKKNPFYIKKNGELYRAFFFGNIRILKSLERTKLIVEYTEEQKC